MISIFFLFKTMLHCKVLFGQMVSAQSIEVGVWYPILHHAGHVTFQRERRFPQRHKADHLNLSIQTERKTTSISQMLLFIIEWLQNVLLDRYGRRARSRGGISDTNVWDQGGYYLWYFSLETWWQWDWRDRRILSTTTQVRNTPEDLAR